MAAVIGILGILVFGGVLLREHLMLTPIVITSFFMLPILIGYIALDAVNGSNLAWLYLSGEIAFLVGYNVYDRLHYNAARVPCVVRDIGPRNISVASFVFLIVVSFVLYHFSQVGVPLFSSDVEVDRFNFSGSGLAGIPGRMYLFGLPFCVFLISNGLRGPFVGGYRLLLIACWAAYICVNLIGGFKGGVTNLLVMGLVVASLNGSPISLRSMLFTRRLLVLIGAILFGIGISFKYGTVGVSSVSQGFSYLALRLTVIAAEPGHFAIREFGISGTYAQQFINDASYFLHKYFAFLGAGPATSFSFEKIVSAGLSQTPLSDDSFLVPVTVGAFPELLVNLGIAASVIIMLLVGMGYSYLYLRSKNSRGPYATAMYAFGLFIMQAYVLNGDLMYGIFNFILMCALLTILYGVSKKIAFVLSMVSYADVEAPG